MSIFKREFWSEGPGSFAIAIGLAIIVRWAFFEAYVIPSASMLPSLLVNDHLFVNKISFGLRVPFSEKWIFKWEDPKRGDVMVFKYPADKDLYYVKRIIGLPGDRIVYENGHLYVNEKLVERTIPQDLKGEWTYLSDRDFPGEKDSGGLSLYVHWEEHLAAKNYSILLHKEAAAGYSFGPLTVPDGHYFVLGDNRDNSQDSRAWTDDKRFVPRDYLIGRASLLWLSCESTLPVLTFLCNPLTIRWTRLLRPVN